MTTVIECHPPVAAKKPTVDLNALKAKQQATWSSGDYAVIGTTLQIVGERLAEAMDLRAGQTVLDVAAGNGNATLAAARRWCEVTSTDYSTRCSKSVASAPKRRGLRSNSAWLMRKISPSPMRPSTRLSRLSARCSLQIRTAPLLK